MVRIIKEVMQNELQSHSEIKTHDEISNLLDSVKNVEETFSNLHFLQNLPEMIQFPSEDLPETNLSPQPEIDSEAIQSIIQQGQLHAKMPVKPDEMIEKQPELIQEFKGRSAFRYYIHENIAKPLIGPPDPGHTTFTLELNNNFVNGFYQIPKETRSLKELGPEIISKTKKVLKSIKERDFKKDVKNLKSLPSILKNKTSKINFESIKALPKKIRGMFSSD